MITIYSPTETNFSHNGHGVIIAREAIVIEELNGMYELSVTISVDGANQNKLEYIANDYILRAPTPRGEQFFRIYDVKDAINNQIRISAEHIFYDLRRTLMDDVSGNLTAGEAISQFVSTAIPKLSFTTSSIGINGVFEIEAINVNPVEALLGSDGLVTLVEGELLRDKFNITLRPNIGSDRGFTVRYRKNLSGLDIQFYSRDIITRIKPYGIYRDRRREDESRNIYLPGVFVNSQRINDYFRPFVKALPFSDIIVDAQWFQLRDEQGPFWWFDELGTNRLLNEAQEELKKRADEFFAAGNDLPTVNVKVDFVMLRDTIEYEQFAALETVYLGDTITVIHPELGIDLKAKCIKIRYDALKGRYINAELGNFRDDFATSTALSVSGLGNTINRIARHQVNEGDPNL